MKDLIKQKKEIEARIIDLPKKIQSIQGRKSDLEKSLPNLRSKKLSKLRPKRVGRSFLLLMERGQKMGCDYPGKITLKWLTDYPRPKSC